MFAAGWKLPCLLRGARTNTITEEDARLRANADDVIVLSKSDPQISALLGVLPLQLLSYHMSVMRGFDPDFPRKEKPSLVFLKTSFTIREHLTPGIVCSTLTRNLDILRLRSFSLAVNSFLRGFFSADTVCRPAAHRLETPSLYAK